MEKFKKNKIYYKNAHLTADRIRQEVAAGIKLLNKIDQPIISFAGSARIKTTHKNYRHCYKLAYKLGKKGFAIISGGGPGIMHAANSGATKAGSTSVGLKAKLLTREKINEKIYTNQANFHYFFIRRFIMLAKTRAMIFYPGGYGTLNELLENAMLIQNKIMDNIPLICVDKKYWTKLFRWLNTKTVKEKYADKFDLSIIKLIDSPQKIVELIEKIC